MRPLEPGMRYAPRVPESFLLVDREETPATPSSPPSAPFPGAAGTSLAAVPQLYPAPGPTELSFLYGQLQGAAFPGTSNTFSAVQTFTAAPAVVLTDTGGGADSDALRPDLLTLDHNTTLATVVGVGGNVSLYCQDNAGNRLRIGRLTAEITNNAAGSVDSTLAFCVQKGSVEVEVLRCRGSLGRATTAASSVANNFVGGEVWAQGNFRHSGTELIFFAADGNTASVGRQTLAAAATDPASVIILANSLRTAMLNLRLGQ